MKKIFVILLTAGCLILLLCSANRPQPDCIGTWELSEKNAAIAEELFMMYGSSLHHYGAGMHIRPDGTFDYSIGLTGGRGTYTVSGDLITAVVTSWNDPHEERLTLQIIRENGEISLLYPVREEAFSVDILWSKK